VNHPQGRVVDVDVLDVVECEPEGSHPAGSEPVHRLSPDSLLPHVTEPDKTAVPQRLRRLQDCEPGAPRCVRMTGPRLSVQPL